MRILAECKQCHTQYDVGDATSGAQCRRCQAALEIKLPRAKLAKVVRCGACGAARGEGGDNCNFCGARFSAADKGWGSMCPGCYCRLPLAAAFCVECGLKIHPVKLNEAEVKLNCPRCVRPLAIRNPEQLSVVEMHECPSCAGTWLDAETFDAVCSDKDKPTLTARVAAAKRQRKTTFDLSPQDIVKYVPCPICQHLMNRRNFASISGVVIDVCKDHGVWLDNLELGRIVQFITAGGMDKSRQRAAEAAREQSQPRKNMTALPLNTPRSSILPAAGGALDVIDIGWSTASLLSDIFFSD